jgi:hypothetical protein
MLNNISEIKEASMSYSRAVRVFLALNLMILGAPFNSAFAGQGKFTKIDVPGGAGLGSYSDSGGLHGFC